jgi:hypothetical protein
MKIAWAATSILMIVPWFASCGGGDSTGGNTGGNNGGAPSVTLNTPSAGANQLSGHAYNYPSTAKIVIYALTNQWYVQPLVDAPFTTIQSDGSWTSSTYPWSVLVVLLVDPASYTPQATEITNPALDPGVLAYAMYPAGPVSLNFSGYTWGIKMTGNLPTYYFDPGPNFWSNNSSVVNVASDGLHLQITNINGLWECGEVYLTKSLGYGTYTVQVASHLDQLQQNTVAAPLFIYVASSGQEIDNEYSGNGGLIPEPYNAQFVVQPYSVPGNIVHYKQPSTAQFTTQMQWGATKVVFSAWSGWANSPTAATLIYQWTYSGNDIPAAGQERVHINLWLLNGTAPQTGVGDEMVINSFTFQPTTAQTAAENSSFAPSENAPAPDQRLSLTDTQQIEEASTPTVPISSPGTISNSQAISEVMGVLGKPSKTMVVDGKSVYVYKDHRVSFVDGTLSDQK